MEEVETGIQIPIEGELSEPFTPKNMRITQPNTFKRTRDIYVQTGESILVPHSDIKDVLEPLTNIPAFKCRLVSIRELVYKIAKCIYLKINNEHTIQKLAILVTLCIEFYRILMGSLLLSFVPQKCGNHVCGITENFYSEGAYYIMYILNLMTLICFSLLYLVEIKRENQLITYLDVNNNKPTDSISVSIIISALSDIDRENILYIDKIYKQIGCCVIGVYVFNTILSGTVIYAYYLDNKTITAFFTNVLFMGYKIRQVYMVVNTENHIFFSAYLKNKVQFNDVDYCKVTNTEIGQRFDTRIFT
jgi:hypothetical protein